MQLIILNAGKLKTAMEDPESAAFRSCQQWCNQKLPRQNTNNFQHNLAELQGVHSDAMGFTIKLSLNETQFGEPAEYFKYIHQVTFMFRRKGMNYIERVNIGHHHWRTRHSRIVSVWNRMMKWLSAGEIELDSDIVIYRTAFNSRALPNVGGPTLRKYPLRLTDNTYAVIAGQVDWLVSLGHALNDEEGNTAFAEWFDANVYDYHANDNLRTHQKRFHKESSHIRARAMYVWCWFNTWGYDLESCFENRDELRGEEGYLNVRSDMLLWKDGKVKVWEQVLTGNQIQADHFALMDYDNDEIPRTLISSDYEWGSDGVFIER